MPCPWALIVPRKIFLKVEIKHQLTLCIPPPHPKKKIRLAHFFIAPAFSENCKDREIRAVDSEYKRNLQDDSRRLFQIGKHTCSRDHPFWHFGTGNLTTLKENPAKEGIDVREELISFYHKYYSANIMKLVIVGRGKDL